MRGAETGELFQFFLQQMGEVSDRFDRGNEDRLACTCLRLSGISYVRVQESKRGDEALMDSFAVIAR